MSTLYYLQVRHSDCGLYSSTKVCTLYYLQVRHSVCVLYSSTKVCTLYYLQVRLYKQPRGLAAKEQELTKSLSQISILEGTKKQTIPKTLEKPPLVTSTGEKSKPKGLWLRGEGDGAI